MATHSTADASCDNLLLLATDGSPTSLPNSPMERAPPSPPPPPPLPYHLREQPSQTRPESDNTPSMVQKFRSAPPNWLTTGYTLDDLMPPKPYEFCKVFYFFYGTLQSPKILSHILEKPVHRSSLRPASVIGYSCLLWGTYKALVDGPMGGVVEGVAYEVQCEEDEARLATYETNAYETAPCYIDLKGVGDGPTPPEMIRGKTFRYAGDPDALREKRFDRKLWIKNMQPEFRAWEY